VSSDVERRLLATVEHLAALERAPCSPGEREAAEWIAGRLRAHGCEVQVEAERVHGSFHWVLLALAGIAGAGGIAALRGRRGLGLLAGALSAASMWEDLSGGRRRWLRRRALPQGDTWNVVAEAGDRSAQRTLVVLAHHDSARTSFIFDQRSARLLAAHAPWLLYRLDRWPPLMWLVVGGPLLVAWGSVRGRRGPLAAGTVVCAGTAAVMADMSTNAVVPGANDNATAVAALVELARDLAERPVAGLRVLLVSTGAEEANQEGIIAFARRHEAELDPNRTSFLCLDTIGSPDLSMVEGEGFLVMRDYPAAFKDRVDAAARAAGVPLRRGLRLSFATDGLIALRAGYPAASVGSVNEYMMPSNYHWPTDTADRVDYRTVAGATRMTRHLIDDLAAHG
jgi:peptidase M28-like protein